MIGVEVYYIEDNVIKKSDIVGAELRELGESRMIIYTLRSGKKVEEKDVCLTIQDVFVKLKREFEAYERSKKENSMKGVRIGLLVVDDLNLNKNKGADYGN